MKTLLILFFALLPLTLKADQLLPEGDQHVAMLEQELDDVLSSNILFKRCLDQNRSSAEVVNAANVLADNYDRLCAHLTQFLYWFKYRSKTSGDPSDISATALARLHDLSDRMNTVVMNSFRELADDINNHPQYDRDLTPVAQRIVASTNAMKSLMARAEGK